jgi:hypothetical protein
MRWLTAVREVRTSFEVPYDRHERLAKNLLLWVIIAVVLMAVFQSFSPRGAGQQALAYDEFISQVRRRQRCQGHHRRMTASPSAASAAMAASS